MTTGCLGPTGSYSQEAAKRLCLDATIRLYPNFPAVVEALRKGEVDEIVLPIENTLEGGVQQNMDLMAKEEDLFAVKELILRIEHRLIYPKGTALSDIRRVFSHPQALGQCSVFLSERLPQAQMVPTDSTAQGPERIERTGDACIVGAHLCRELTGYDVYPGNIADEENDFTYFHLIRKGEQFLPKHSEKVYFAAELLDRPGALCVLLAAIDRHGLNMTKIESRPIKDRPGEYRFFIELDGDYHSPTLVSAIGEIRGICQHFKLLGAY